LKKGWDIAALAGEAGCTVRTIERIEAGKPCYVNNLTAIAKALGLGSDCTALMAASKRVWPKGRQVILLRREKKWTQKTLAEKAGCSPVDVKAVEKCHQTTEEIVQRIGEALGYASWDSLIEQDCTMVDPVSQPQMFQMMLLHFRTFVSEILGHQDPPEVLVNKVLIALRRAANYTLSYENKLKCGAHRDHDFELRLSDLWLDVLDLYSIVEPKGYNVWALLDFKTQFWADRDRWTLEEIEQSGISLAPLVIQLEQSLKKSKASPRDDQKAQRPDLT
jgi:transcriptional regulator with XRE-family HTH domain